jgi:hypothetical protein
LFEWLAIGTRYLPNLPLWIGFFWNALLTEFLSNSKKHDTPQGFPYFAIVGELDISIMMHPKTGEENEESFARKSTRDKYQRASFDPKQQKQQWIENRILSLLVSSSVLQCKLVCIDHYNLLIAINYVLFRRYIFEPKRHHGQAFVVQVGTEQCWQLLSLPCTLTLVWLCLTFKRCVISCFSLVACETHGSRLLVQRFYMRDVTSRDRPAKQVQRCQGVTTLSHCTQQPAWSIDDGWLQLSRLLGLGGRQIPSRENHARDSPENDDNRFDTINTGKVKPICIQLEEKGIVKDDDGPGGVADSTGIKTKQRTCTLVTVCLLLVHVLQEAEWTHLAILVSYLGSPRSCCSQGTY